LAINNQISDDITQFLGEKDIFMQRTYTKDQLSLRLSPLLERQDFISLLQQCDLNFVRGEDSLTLGIMSGKPLIWHIYPQTDNAHHGKLAAFLRHYTKDMPEPAAKAVTNAMHYWNHIMPATPDQAAAIWSDYEAHYPEIFAHTQNFAEKMRKNGDCVKNIMDFCAKLR
jgi:uncharacterized repeat protein (TIGR03837 family)